MSTVVVRFTSSKQLAWLRVSYPCWHITRDEPGEAALTARRPTDRGVAIVEAPDGDVMAGILQEKEGHSRPRA
jgi:hypothetical protein